MSFLRGSFSPKSYFPAVWFAEADDGHLLPEEQSGGMVAAMAERDARKIAAFRRQVAEQQALERRLAAERSAKDEAERQAVAERIEQEQQRIAAIEAYRVQSPIIQPVIDDIRQDIVEIDPELLQKLNEIAQKPKLELVASAPKIESSEPDYSDEIALIMILLEAA